MRIFVTGATGWIGRAVVTELIANGHGVLGLTRSADKGHWLTEQGAQVLIGSLSDLATLKQAVETVDAVAHIGFDHDFSRYAENAEQDARVIAALGAGLVGTDKPLVVSATLSALVVHGRAATEADLPVTRPSYPRRSEQAARQLIGVRSASIRLPHSVHGVGETHGFVPMLIDLAKRTGISAYLADGENRWPAVHVGDAARLYRLVLESGSAHPTYHAADENVAFRAIAEAIGRKLDLPIVPRDMDHFGWLAGFVGEDLTVSSVMTREVLGWRTDGPRLLADIQDAGYYMGS